MGGILSTIVLTEGMDVAIAMSVSKPNMDGRVPALVVRSADGEQRTIKLDQQQSMIFGRTKGDILIQDHEISSTHCRIHYVGGAYHVLDMRSTNGTFVNNVRILKSKLQHNDLITIGQSSICFQMIAAAELIGKDGGDGDDEQEDSLALEGDHEGTSAAEPVQLRINAAYHDGSSESLVFADKSEVLIGRNSEFGRFKDDEQLSRVHVRVFIDDGEVYIEDKNSTNGVFINSQKMTGVQAIASTDIVVIGNTYLQISMQE